VVILGASKRFGVGNSAVDNVSQGGMAVRINTESGIIRGCAYDKRASTYEAHPTSGVVFNGQQIPFWNEVKSLAIRAQNEMDFQRLLGMDISVTEEGPVLIEMNSIYDNISLERTCGPLLKSPEVLEFYYRNDLLYNDRQRALAQRGLGHE
jgi:hypothetical protein